MKKLSWLHRCQAPMMVPMMPATVPVAQMAVAPARMMAVAPAPMMSVAAAPAMASYAVAPAASYAPAPMMASYAAMPAASPMVTSAVAPPGYTVARLSLGGGGGPSTASSGVDAASLEAALAEMRKLYNGTVANADAAKAAQSAAAAGASNTAALEARIKRLEDNLAQLKACISRISD